MSCVATDWTTEAGRRELQAALAGDDRAWRRFYQRCQPLITATVSNLLRARNIPFARDDLDDYVAEVWLALLRRDAVGLRRFDPDRGRSLPSWIRLLAVRTTIDRLRGRGLQQRLRERGGPEIDGLGERGGHDERCRPDVVVETRQRAAEAHLALCQLKPRDRLFMELYLQDTDTDEVARRLGIAAATVHSRRFKLGQKLARLVRQRQRPGRRSLH